MVRQQIGQLQWSVTSLEEEIEQEAKKRNSKNGGSSSGGSGGSGGSGWEPEEVQYDSRKRTMHFVDRERDVLQELIVPADVARRYTNSTKMSTSSGDALMRASQEAQEREQVGV
jgi:hypothetical protein